MKSWRFGQNEDMAAKTPRLAILTMRNHLPFQKETMVRISLLLIGGIDCSKEAFFVQRFFP
jgi:hypothetical protein